jgi:hypothetical protein
VAAVTAALVLFIAGAPAGLDVKPRHAVAQEQTQKTATEPARERDGDDGGDVPIWAGIGLILLAAAAGSLAARARNRRRMRDLSRD